MSAPRGIRTPNNCFEGRHDIHFTMGAIAYIIQHKLILPSIYVELVEFINKSDILFLFICCGYSLVVE